MIHLEGYGSESDREECQDQGTYEDNFSEDGNGVENERSGSSLSIQQIIKLVRLEEKKIHEDTQHHKGLMPTKPKRGSSSLANDSKYRTYLEKRSNFSEYVKERRSSESGLKSVLDHISQCIPYVKREKPEGGELTEMSK